MNAKPDHSWGTAAFMDGEWAMRFEKSTILEAISQCATRMGTVSEDRYDATDYLVEIPKAKVACRIRRLSSIPSRSATDITIRSKRRSGAKTELAKLRERKVDLYVYAWVGDSGIRKVSEYVVFDVPLAFKAGLLRVSSSNEIWNRDGGSSFIVVQLSELQQCGALIARRKYGLRGSFSEIQAKWAAFDKARGCNHDRPKWVDGRPKDGRIRTACQCGKFIGYRLDK